jgi:hypothetical protein
MVLTDEDIEQHWNDLQVPRQPGSLLRVIETNKEVRDREDMMMKFIKTFGDGVFGELK